MAKIEEKLYLVPEIDVKISRSWINLVQYCQGSFPYGDLYVEIDNGQPGKRLKEVPSIRFDIQPKVKEGLCYIIQSLDVRIQQSWINMIQWCQITFVSGKIGIRIISAQPTELLSAKQNPVNFSKLETIPTGGMPLNFERLDKF